MRVFQYILINGLLKKYLKYKIVKICPIFTKGYSMGLAPIQVRIRNIIKKNQNIILLKKKYELPWIFLLKIRGIKNKIKIDINNAITPPNFLGIDRRME